jgi:hypothetical protein
LLVFGLIATCVWPAGLYYRKNIKLNTAASIVALSDSSVSSSSASSKTMDIIATAPDPFATAVSDVRADTVAAAAELVAAAERSAVVLVIVHLRLQEQCFQLYKMPELCFTEADGKLFGQWTGSHCIPTLRAVLGRLQHWAQCGYLTAVTSWIGGVSMLASNERAKQVYLMHLL